MPAAQGGAASANSLVVSGCGNATVSEIIKGTYVFSGTNHGKNVYKKEGGNTAVSVLIYFWDERDGPNFSGWWFGPKVGGDQVWAYSANRASQMPPTNGWKVPWDGPEDMSLRLTFNAPAAPAAPAPAPPAPGRAPPPPGQAPPQQGQQQQWPQQGQGQQQQQQQQQQQWSQQGNQQQQWSQQGPPQGQGQQWSQQGNQQGNQQWGNQSQQWGNQSQQGQGQQWGGNQQQGQQQQWGGNQQQWGQGGPQGGARMPQNNHSQMQAQQNQEAERKRREAENARWEEQQRRRREEDERRRKQQEEERRQRQEEWERERVRKEAEAKRRREEEEVRRKEQAAAQTVRKVIQRVRIATQDTYDALRAELEEAQSKNLEAMGSQAEKVSQEAQQTLEQTQKRIDDAIKKKEEDEKRRIEDEKRRKEEAEKVDAILKEISEEVERVEGTVTETQEQGKEIDKDLTPEELIETSGALIVKIKETRELLNKTYTFVTEKSKEMGNNDAAWNASKKVTDATSTINGSIRAIDRLWTNAEHCKERASKKAVALKKQQERKDAFAEVDGDSDGKLNRDEVLAFSQSQFDFEPAKEVLDRIMSALEPIGFEKFRPLFQKLAIAKSEVAARVKRAEEEERQRKLEEQKAAILAIVEAATACLSKVDEALGRAETAAWPLQDSRAEPSASELRAAADAVDAEMTEVETQLEQVVAQTEQIGEQCATDKAFEGISWRELPRLESRRERALARKDKAVSAAASGRERAVRREYAEMDARRVALVAAIREKMGKDGQTSEQYFKDVIGDGACTKEKFVELAKSFEELKLEEEQADGLYKHVAKEADEISKEKFMELIRLFYKCVRNTVLNEELGIKSKMVRRLEENEVLEAIEGPSKEDGLGLLRVKVKAVQDDATGWATIAGNQGTPFLTPGGNFYTCVKETVLTDGLGVSDSKTVRRILKGEVIEVIEFTKKDSDLDIRRIKGMAKNDGAIGWITISGNQGTAFLEPC